MDTPLHSASLEWKLVSKTSMNDCAIYEYECKFADPSSTRKYRKTKVVSPQKESISCHQGMLLL